MENNKDSSQQEEKKDWTEIEELLRFTDPELFGYKY